MVNKKQKHRGLKKIGIAVTLILTSLSIGAVATGKVNLLNNPNQVTSVAKDNHMKKIIGSMNALADDNNKGNPTSISDDKLAHPNEYPNWVQYWGPWAQEFGGKGTGGAHWCDSAGENNKGCFATALAIQLARGGATKDSKNNEMNPGNNWKDNPHAQFGCVMTNTFKTDRGTITEDPQAGTQSKTTISAGAALDKCKKIADAGNYPLIRVNQGGHTVAYWKPGNGAPLFYDPARGYNGTAVQSYTAVGALSGGNLKKFSTSSPGPNGGADTTLGNGDNSSNSSDSASNDSGNNDDASSTAPQEGAAIKPIFNPFRAPSIKPMPADEIGQGGSEAPTESRAELYQLADGAGPYILSLLRLICYGGIYLFAAITVIGMGAQLINVWLGGWLDNWVWKHSGGVAGDLFFPNGTILGIGGNTALEVLQSAVVKFLPIAVVLLLAVSGTYSRLIAWGLEILGTNIAPHFFR